MCALFSRMPVVNGTYAVYMVTKRAPKVTLDTIMHIVAEKLANRGIDSATQPLRNSDSELRPLRMAESSKLRARVTQRKTSLSFSGY